MVSLANMVPDLLDVWQRPAADRLRQLGGSAPGNWRKYVNLPAKPTQTRCLPISDPDMGLDPFLRTVAR